MAASVLVLLTKKFANEFGQIQWQSTDPAQTHTVASNLLAAIKHKVNQAGAMG